MVFEGEANDDYSIVNNDKFETMMSLAIQLTMKM